jgi:hypothetical protein
VIISGTIELICIDDDKYEYDDADYDGGGGVYIRCSRSFE